MSFQQKKKRSTNKRRSANVDQRQVRANEPQKYIYPYRTVDWRNRRNQRQIQNACGRIFGQSLRSVKISGKY